MRARRFYERNGFTANGDFLDDNIGGKDMREIMYIREEAWYNFQDAEFTPFINGVQEIIFNLEELKYISSSGIRVLLTIKKKIGNMKVLKPTEEVMEVFEITGLSDVFDIEK